MPYGYLGQNTPNQTVSNSGVFSISDVADLEKQGKFGGSLELIEEQTVSGSPSTIDFINLANNPFDVYLVHISNLISTSQTQISYRFSNDNGTTFQSGASDYEYSGFRIISNGAVNDPRSTGASGIGTDAYTNTSTSNFNSYVYLYNLLDSTKYSSLTQHSTTNLAGNFRTTFGGGVYQTAETINAFQILTSSTLTSGNAKLYGIKEI
jgi:hypothetical protein